MHTDKHNIKNIALHESLMWDNHDYYDQAEHFLKNDWKIHIWPILKTADFSTVLDLAAGHGRNSAQLIKLAKKLYIVDIHQSNINFCKIRFRKYCNIEYTLCDGISCNGVPDDTVTLVYCFDAMVHFDSDVIRNYLKDISRILKHGGTAFLHHSNYGKNPEGWFQDNPHARNL